MPEEIERKFLASAPPEADGIGPGARLRQGYLALDGDIEVRIRLTGDAAQLTVKAKGGLSRTEVELPLAADDAEALWLHTDGRRLEKVRTKVPLAGGLVAEIDDYEGALAGLRTVEVEFPDLDAAAAFSPPAWFGTELTGDNAWTNAALAQRGRPAGW
jgi:adenylate cyclase